MDPQDSFRERVQALVAEGKLTPEEAEQLLSPAARGPRPPEPPAAPAPVLPVFSGEVPPRLNLHVAGYSLTVRVDPDATVPQLSANHPDRLELLGTADGWRVARTPLNFQERGAGWAERLINSLVSEGNLRAELVIPAGITDVHAKVQGGNLTVGDLDAPVHATVQGGNLTLGEARALHAKVQGGNLRWTATVHDGDHELKVQGGNANVELREGSSVRFDGQATAGNITANGFPVTRTSRDFVNTTCTGVLNDGRAQLAVRVQGGNARVVTV